MYVITKKRGVIMMIKKLKETINWFAFSTAIQIGCIYYFLNLDLFDPYNDIWGKMIVAIISAIVMIVLCILLQNNFKKNNINNTRNLFIGVNLIYAFSLFVGVFRNNALVDFLILFLLCGSYFFVDGMQMLTKLLYYRLKNRHTKESIEIIIELVGFLLAILSIICTFKELW